MMRSILIVDDDEKARQLLKTYLEKNSFEVHLANNGRSFLTKFEKHADELALVILDVMLPDTDGFVLCKTVRSRSQVPIIMLTSSSDETDRVVGLELGADDYVAKPYSPRELLARIKAIHRRMGVDATGTPRYFRFAGFTLDALERTVTDSDGAPVSLTGMDFQLLKYFVEHPGAILDRGQLCEETRGRDVGPLDRSLDVQIARLRVRLKDDGKNPTLIKSIRGVGYVFSAPVAASQN